MVYFLKILPKPTEAPGNTLFKGVRRKFNSTLQDMLQGYHSFGFINVHEITTREKDERFFISPRSGLLSDEGVIQLWDSISQTFKAIDNRMKPKTLMKSQHTQWDPKDFEKRPSKHSRENQYNSHWDGHQTSHNRFSRNDHYGSRSNFNSNSYYY